MQYKHWFVSILFVGALSFLAACAQKPTAPANDNPFDTENPATHGDPFHLQASIANGGVTLKWQIPAVHHLKHFNLYKSIDSNEDFKLLKQLAATSTQYTDQDISNGYTYFYRIAAVSTYNTATSISNIVPVAVSTQPVLVINGGALYTNSIDVSLTIIAGAAKEMMLSNSADFNGARWKNFLQRKNWQLQPDEGQKKVYLKIKYITGDTSQTVHSSIILDTTPPLAVLSVIPDSGIANETSFQFDPTQSHDNFTITSQLIMRLDVQNDGVWDVDWQPMDLFGQVFTVGGGSKQARLQIKDMADNISDTTVSYFVNTRPEARFTVSADANDDHLYHFDASASQDYEDGKNLRYRWDWQGDGSYDTPFQTDPKIDHRYSSNGTFNPTLQVEDQNGLRSSATRTIKVGFAIAFEKTFGGSDYDFGNDVQQTADGNYIVVGATKSFGAGNYDAYLIKTDATGNKIWAKTFGGSNVDVGNALQITQSGYVFVGSTQSQGAGASDVWLVKTDKDGTKTLEKTFGGSGSDQGNGLQKTSDGGFIIVGNTQSYGSGGSDIWLIKTDGNGNKSWDRTFGGGNDEIGNKVRQTADGGFIIIGTTKSFGSGDYDFWLVKTDAQGQKQWDRTFGGSLEDIGYDVQQTDDGGFIVCGATKSNAPGNVSDVWLIKTDAQGNMQWQKRFGGDGTDEAYALRISADGGFILSGYTDSKGNGLGDMWLIKTNSVGELEWSKTLGGSSFDKGKALQITSDGGTIITGYTSSSGNGSYDVWLVKAE